MSTNAELAASGPCFLFRALGKMQMIRCSSVEDFDGVKVRTYRAFHTEDQRKAGEELWRARVICARGNVVSLTFFDKNARKALRMERDLRGNVSGEVFSYAAAPNGVPAEQPRVTFLEDVVFPPGIVRAGGPASNTRVVAHMPFFLRAYLGL